VLLAVSQFGGNEKPLFCPPGLGHRKPLPFGELTRSRANRLLSFVILQRLEVLDQAKPNNSMLSSNTHVTSLVPSSSRLVSLPSHARIKLFSTTCKRNTHYQTLGVTETASKSQIKVRVCLPWSLPEATVENQYFNLSLIFTRSHHSEHLPTYWLIHIVQ